jgi:prepilin signal peptidase PulO-like enzyme (type II secretory pathway)
VRARRRSRLRARDWYLGWQGLRLPLAALFVAFVLSAVVGLGSVALRRSGRGRTLPFGHYLAADALTVLLLA